MAKHKGKTNKQKQKTSSQIPTFGITTAHTLEECWFLFSVDQMHISPKMHSQIHSENPQGLGLRIFPVLWIFWTLRCY